jgi:hypothetical protein
LVKLKLSWEIETYKYQHYLIVASLPGFWNVTDILDFKPKVCEGGNYRKKKLHRLKVSVWVETPAKSKTDIHIATELTLCAHKLYNIFLSW